MGNKRFINEYWNYYLELEEQFIKSRRYVAFDPDNYQVFSTEYTQLIQTICSEIDVVGKIIAQRNKNFKLDSRANIKKWGFEVQKAFKDIDLKTIYFNNEIELRPFDKWKYKTNNNSII